MRISDWSSDVCSSDLATNATSINLGTSTNLNGNLTLTEGATRTIGVQTRTTNAAGNDLTISAGTARSGASAFGGGKLTLQGGNAEIGRASCRERVCQ